MRPWRTVPLALALAALARIAGAQTPAWGQPPPEPSGDASAPISPPTADGDAGAAIPPLPPPEAPPPSPQAPPETPAPPEPRPPAPEREEREEVDETRQQIVRRQAGLQLGLSPGFFFDDGVRFMAAAGVGYGFDTGSFIIAPGLGVTVRFPKAGSLWTVAPHVRAGIPLGPFYPFLEPEVGIALSSADTLPSPSPLFGATLGFYVYPISALGIGLAGSYTALTRWDAHFWSVTPLLDIAF
jgi:hypothetical protein